MKNDTSLRSTFYSGSKIEVFIICLLVIGLVYLLVTYWARFMELYAGATPLEFFIVVIISLAIIVVAILNICGIWSITLTSKELIARNIVVISRIPITSIRGIVIHPQPIMSERYNLFRVYYVNANGDEAVLSIPRTMFSLRVLQDFQRIFLSCYPGIPLFKDVKSMANHLKKIECINPIAKVPANIYLMTLTRFLGLQSSFSEATLFLMSTSFLLLFWLDREVIILDALRILEVGANSDKGPGVLLYLGCTMGLGLFFSLYHILKRGRKSRFAQRAMIYYAIGMSSVTGILSGVFTWHHASGWWGYLVASWTVLYSALLFASLKWESDIHSVENRDAKLNEVFVGLIVISIIAYVNATYYHMYWAINYGLCIAYATLVNSKILHWFPGVQSRMPTVGIRIPNLPRITTVNRQIFRVCFLAAFYLVLIYLSAMGG